MTELYLVINVRILAKFTDPKDPNVNNQVQFCQIINGLNGSYLEVKRILSSKQKLLGHILKGVTLKGPQKEDFGYWITQSG